MVNMVKRALILAMLFCLVSGYGLCAQPLQIQPINASLCVRNKAGHLWVAGQLKIQGKSKSGLFRWDGKSWHTALLETETRHNIGLVLRRDGGVLCLWRSQQEEPQHTVTFHFSEHKATPKGNTMRWLGQWTVAYHQDEGTGQTRLLPGGTQALWIHKRQVSLVSTDGKARLLHVIPPAQMMRVGKAEELSDNQNSMLALEDACGQLWMWSDVWDNGSRAWSLRGLLRWDGRKTTHHATLPGFPKGNFAVNAVARKDARHLWVFLGKAGLYEVDCHTLRARRLPTPTGRVFQYAQQIEVVGSDVYVVFGSRWAEDDEDTSLLYGHLWRWRKGQWRQIIPGMDATNGYTSSPRQIVINKAGLWTTSRDSGVWFVPEGEGKPIALNWRQGVPLSEPNFLFDTPQGIMTGHWNTMLLIKDHNALLRRRPAPGFLVMPTYVKLAQDKQRRVWVILSLRYNALSEWNGTRWVHYAVPRHYKLTDIAELAFDRLGRVWLLPYNSHGQTAIYDPRPQSAAKGAAWQVFPNYRAALLAELKVTPQNPPYPQFLPELDDGHDPRPWQTPDARGQRLCYLGADAIVHYYDGARWQHWTVKAITGLKSNSIDLDDPVYFGQGDVLTLPVGGKVWRYESKGGQSRWKEYPHSDEEQDRRHWQTPLEHETVPGHELPAEDSSTPLVYTDRNGEGWYLWKRQLYKAVPGLKAAQFAPGANHPFLDERPLNTVLVDKFGTVFCDTGEELVILLPTAPTVMRAKAYAKSIDSFVIDCATQPQRPQGEHRFRWRLNGGPWSAWRTSPRFLMSDLPGGTHRLEVMSLDARLRPSPKPAVVTLKVHLDADKQVADFIADLSSPDYGKREKAVVGLAKQPQLALPALRAARQKANADLKWWIDAAIQAAEAQK